MENRQELEQRVAAKLEMDRREAVARNKRKTIFGIVCPKKGLIRCYQKIKGVYKKINPATNPPDMFVPAKMERFLTVAKRTKIVIGGRGSGKSHTGVDISLAWSKDDAAKFGCFRQFQNSISDSTYSLLSEEIDRLKLSNFKILTSTVERDDNRSQFVFKGLERNTESVKSMNGFNVFMIDEAQTVSEEAFRVLTPTLRTKDSEIWMFANPRSSADPFSEKYIVPHQEEIDKNGYYEDDNIMIIVMNYYDNPFFPAVLEQERQYDYENLPRSMYNHIWLGHHNDSVSDAIIEPEWFDACLDAHKHKAFRKSMKEKGAVVCAHDVSDTGKDDKAYCMRHGSVVKSIKFKEDGDIADGADWACDLAVRDNCDVFTFDASGMGVGIRKDVNAAFNGKNILVDEHRGGNSPDDATKYYDMKDKKNRKTNAEVFKNKRAQYMWRLRDKMYNTYRVIVKGEYIDPDECLSLDKSGIQSIEKLRAEVCRQPLKPNANGLIQLMSKQEMKKIGIPSPNMLDALAMTMIIPQNVVKRTKRKSKLKYKGMSMC
tara:strand:+ start:6338 stop:7966 length:1629 start_codon:yes stop_codon:yes gene_type:complete